MVRLFVGTFLDEAERSRVHDIQNCEMAKNLAGQYSTAWTKPEKLHLTWCFLGEVAEASIQALIQLLSDSLLDLQALTKDEEPAIIFDELTCWKKNDIPNVLVLAPTELSQTILAISNFLTAATKPFSPRTGFESEFLAHITLARTRQTKKPQSVLRSRVMRENKISQKTGAQPLATALPLMLKIRQIDLIQSVPELKGKPPAYYSLLTMAFDMSPQQSQGIIAELNK